MRSGNARQPQRQRQRRVLPTPPRERQLDAGVFELRKTCVPYERFGQQPKGDEIVLNDNTLVGCPMFPGDAILLPSTSTSRLLVPNTFSSAYCSDLWII